MSAGKSPTTPTSSVMRPRTRPKTTNAIWGAESRTEWAHTGIKRFIHILEGFWVLLQSSQSLVFASPDLVGNGEVDERDQDAGEQSDHDEQPHPVDARDGQHRQQQRPATGQPQLAVAEQKLDGSHSRLR